MHITTKMFLFVAILSLLVATCGGLLGVSPRILGGTDASIEDFPYTASIEWQEYGGHFCGGTILDANWVLTDAWCTPDPANVTEFSVRVGSATLGNGVLHNVTEWIFHPLAIVYYHEYDFALVKVDPPFEFNANVAAAALPALDQETPDGATGVVTGWGKVDDDPADIVSQMQYANVSLVGDADCASILWLDYNNRTLCARGMNDEVALCKRDEGGPLVVDGTLFGVAIWPRVTCADPRDVQIFARVASVRDWIDETVGTLEEYW